MNVDRDIKLRLSMKIKFLKLNLWIVFKYEVNMYFFWKLSSESLIRIGDESVYYILLLLLGNGSGKRIRWS